MFRNRFTSYSYRQNYIRRPRYTFDTSTCPYNTLDTSNASNASTDNKINTRINDNEVEVVNYEIPNEDFVVPNEKVNYELLNEVDYEIQSDYEMPNETETATNPEVLNIEFFAEEELLEDELFNRESFNELYDDDDFDELSNDDEFNEDELSATAAGAVDNNGDGGDNDKIVDKALSSEQMLHTDGDFAPYFKNITEALMFCWIQKHNISTRAYDELVDIIHHPQFKMIYNCGDFVVYKESIARIGRILAIVEINSKLKIIIQRVLRFDELPNHLQSNNRRERSHREVWLLD
ncbi:unnamed protein product [Rhizophagus irregularis]|nr:unnamed protein product [Rhizophagus irregularis]